MKKYISLIRASMTEGMNLFRISAKNQNKYNKVLLPIFLVLIFMGAMYSYAETLIKVLKPINMEYVVLTIFIFATSILTLIEGIYKSGNLLFNCKDDNLLLSLPISKTTVLFIRVLKFYIFELLYNSMFLLPAIIVYAIHTNPNVTYYLMSIIGLLVFPIIPIALSCVIGTIITYISSKFKGKKIVQTLVTICFLLGVLYISYNSQNLFNSISENASNINNNITTIYYPARVYIELITTFNLIEFIKFIGINLILFIIAILLIGRVYFSVNTNTKSIRKNYIKKDYKIKTLSPTKALIKKELNRFFNSPVFITNAGFGLVLFILGCILVTIKFDIIAETLIEETSITIEYIKGIMPVLLFGFISFTSFMTSITSSMISLEGKAFNILKSLPLKPYEILRAKVLTAILIMIPCILIGDIIIFIRFSFDLVSIVLSLIVSVLLPLIAETIGIIVNLKYPRMDAKNDTEVVKQSMSSAISIFIGVALIGLTLTTLFIALSIGISRNITMLGFILICIVFYLILTTILKKTCNKSFDNIVT